MQRNRSYTLAKVPQGISHGIHPPFECPWRTPPDNCSKVSDTPAEHHDHIKKEHEWRELPCQVCGKPAMKSKGTKECKFCSNECRKLWFRIPR